MRRRERRAVILYPVYFDREKSRSEGRRIPLHLAVEKPSTELMAKAATELGYEIEVEPERKHPRAWFEYSGRIAVFTEERKGEVLRKIAERMCLLAARKHPRSP